MPGAGTVLPNVRDALSELNRRLRLALRNVWLKMQRLVSPPG
jgi:hypothetical protein